MSIYIKYNNHTLNDTDFGLRGILQKNYFQARVVLKGYFQTISQIFGFQMNYNLQ